jgi:uncharacterized protein (TIGR03792 family)
MKRFTLKLMVPVVALAVLVVAGRGESSPQARVTGPQAGSERSSLHYTDTTAVEVLKFKVKPGITVARFLELDKEIWTAQLQTYKGFLRKDVWVSPEAPDEVTFVIYWATREQWKSIPEQELIETDQRFIAAVGAENFEFVSSLEFKPYLFK